MDPIPSVSPVGINRLLWLFLGFGGRVNRLAYVLAALLMGVILMFTFYRIGIAPKDSSEQNAWLSVFFILGLLSAWSSVALAAKRLHDFGKPGIIALALLVPAVSVVAFLVLCIVPGDEGSNEYGERTNAPA